MSWPPWFERREVWNEVSELTLRLRASEAGVRSDATMAVLDGWVVVVGEERVEVLEWEL